MTAREHVVRLIIVGRVQGVGFRYWLHGEAERLGVSGWVRNLPSGAVEAVVAGSEASVAELARLCEAGPTAARVERVERHLASAPENSGFRIVS